MLVEKAQLKTRFLIIWTIYIDLMVPSVANCYTVKMKILAHIRPVMYHQPGKCVQLSPWGWGRGNWLTGLQGRDHCDAHFQVRCKRAARLCCCWHQAGAGDKPGTPKHPQTMPCSNPETQTQESTHCHLCSCCSKPLLRFNLAAPVQLW